MHGQCRIRVLSSAAIPTATKYLRSPWSHTGGTDVWLILESPTLCSLFHLTQENYHTST